MQELIDRHAQHVAIYRRHALHAPVLRMFAHEFIERGNLAYRALEEADGKSWRLHGRIVVTQKRRDDFLGAVFPDFPLEEHLQRKLAGFSA
jgi:hypothetical protein